MVFICCCLLRIVLPEFGTFVLELEVICEEAVAIAFLAVVADRLVEVASNSPLNASSAAFASGHAHHDKE